MVRWLPWSKRTLHMMKAVLKMAAIRSRMFTYRNPSFTYIRKPRWLVMMANRQKQTDVMMIMCEFYCLYIAELYWQWRWHYCVYTAFSTRHSLECVVFLYIVSGKKETKMFFVMSSTRLGQFRWNLIYSFLNKFAVKSCKHFSPQLNNVFALPCETWNAHHACATNVLS